MRAEKTAWLLSYFVVITTQGGLKKGSENRLKGDSWPRQKRQKQSKIAATVDFRRQNLFKNPLQNKKQCAIIAP